MRETLVDLDMGMLFAGQAIAGITVDIGKPRVGCTISHVRDRNLSKAAVLSLKKKKDSHFLITQPSLQRGGEKE